LTTHAAATPVNEVVEERTKRHASPAVKLDDVNETEPSIEPLPAAKRQAILREVRDHLELLKEFEGVVCELI
jgi:hypothetical protein